MNKSGMTLLLALALGPFLSSCMTIGQQFTFEGLEKIMIGKSTMAEVREALGTPQQEVSIKAIPARWMHFGDESAETRWGYLYGDGSMFEVNAKTLVVEFDAKGRVTDYESSSTYKKDGIKLPEREDQKDFDIYVARKRIRPGKTVEEDVRKLMGEPTQIKLINKVGSAKRWIYYFSKDNWADKKRGPMNIDLSDRFSIKELKVDLDKAGRVTDVRGRSDFPADKDRFFTK